MGFWFAGLYQDWLPGIDALLMGMCVAASAPVGDLFASMIKRDLDDQGHRHAVRPARRPDRPPRRRPVHGRRRVLPVGRVRVLNTALLKNTRSGRNFRRRDLFR